MKYKIKGTVTRNAEFNGKRVVNIMPSKEDLEAFEAAINEEFPDGFVGSPIKENGDGISYLKSTTGFDVAMYKSAKPSGLDVSEVGVYSEVEVQLNVKTTKFNRKNYVVAYLLAMNVLDYVKPEDYNPFLD